MDRSTVGIEGDSEDPRPAAHEFMLDRPVLRTEDDRQTLAESHGHDPVVLGLVETDRRRLVFVDGFGGLQIGVEEEDPALRGSDDDSPFGKPDAASATPRTRVRLT